MRHQVAHASGQVWDLASRSFLSQAAVAGAVAAVVGAGRAGFARGPVADIVAANGHVAVQSAFQLSDLDTEVVPVFFATGGSNGTDAVHHRDIRAARLQVDVTAVSEANSAGLARIVAAVAVAGAVRVAEAVAT